MAKKSFDITKDLIVEKGFFRNLDGGEPSKGRSKKKTAKKTTKKK